MARVMNDEHAFTAGKLAQAYDDAMDISCEWRRGDKDAFEQWLDAFAQPANQAAKPDRYEDAQSECGGGSEAAYWYVEGSDILGYETSMPGLRYRIPLAALDHMPDVLLGDLLFPPVKSEGEGLAS